MRLVLARWCAALCVVLLAAACGGGGGTGGSGDGGSGGGTTFVPNFRPASIQAVPSAAIVNRSCIALCCLGPKVTVLYYDISTSSIYARRSLDAGATWLTPDILVAVSPGVGRLSVASHGDRVHVGWTEGYTVTYPTGRVLVASSPDLGGTWTVPARLDPPAFGGPLGEVAVVCSATNACLAWNQYPPSAAPADEIPIQVWTIASLDGGASFAATTIQQHGVSGRAQVLSEGLWCEGSDVALAFRDEPQTGADRDVAVRCVLSTDGGVTWGSAQRVDRVGAGTGDSAAAKNAYVTGSSGHVAVLWGIDTGGPEAGVRTNHTLDGGATWGSADLLAVPGDQALEGIRRLRGLGGRVFVSHRNPGPPSGNGVVASSAGGAWTDSAPLNRLPPGGTVSASPMLGTSQGTLVSAWVDLEGSTYTVRGAWSTDGGRVWSPDTPFHVPGVAVTLADACVDLPYAYLLLQGGNSFWLVASAP